MLVAEKISRERQLRKMSLAEFGTAIGVDKATVSRYEKGLVKTIPIDVLHRIADTFEYDFDEFIADDPKYCILASKEHASDESKLSSEDRQLLVWYHSLPYEIKNAIKQFWGISIKV